MKAPRLEKLWNELSEQERQEIEARAQELIAREKARRLRRRARRE